jgi:hypothetical protein
LYSYARAIDPAPQPPFDFPARNRGRVYLDSDFCITRYVKRSAASFDKRCELLGFDD